MNIQERLHDELALVHADAHDLHRLAIAGARRRRDARRWRGAATVGLAAASVVGVVTVSGLVGSGGTPEGAAGTDPAPARVRSDDGPWPGSRTYEEALADELRSAGPEQREAFADDQVTRAEYVAGFDHFRRCLDEQGIELMFVSQSEPIITYGTPAAVSGSGADQECLVRHFLAIQVAWEMAYWTR